MWIAVDRLPELVEHALDRPTTQLPGHAGSADDQVQGAVEEIHRNSTGIDVGLVGIELESRARK